MTSLSATIIIASRLPEIFVGAPVLGELDRGAHQLAVICVSSFFSSRSNRVKASAVAPAKPPITPPPAPSRRTFFALGLITVDCSDDLAVAGDHRLAVLAHADDRRAVPAPRSLPLSSWSERGKAENCRARHRQSPVIRRGADAPSYSRLRRLDHRARKGGGSRPFETGLEDGELAASQPPPMYRPAGFCARASLRRVSVSDTLSLA